MSRLAVFALLSLVAHAAALMLLPGDGSLVEVVYAGHVYPAVGPVVAWLPAKLPFSLAGMLIAALVILMPVHAANHSLRWRKGRLSLRAAVGRVFSVWVVAAAVIFHSFFLFWGYNYLRQPLEQRLGIAGIELTAEQALERARGIVRDAAARRIEVVNWDRDELDLLVDEAIAGAVLTLTGRPVPVVSPLKGDYGTRLLARFGNRGVVSPWSLEAHVDFGLPGAVLPFAAAHEKAHLAGFARERDASFVAWYALTQADDPRLNYAGYLGIVPYFLNPETRGLAGPLMADLQAASRYQAANVSESLMRSGQGAYRVYLRANRVADGIGDYRQVARMIAAWIELGTRTP